MSISAFVFGFSPSRPLLSLSLSSLGHSRSLVREKKISLSYFAEDTSSPVLAKQWYYADR